MSSKKIPGIPEINSSPKSVYGYTLGCRLNSYETEAMLDDLVSACQGFRVENPEQADLILVNTCAVTGRSQARSRKAVRSLSSKYPKATLLVTGCVAEIAPDDFSEIDPQRIVIVPNDGKSSIAQFFGADSGVAGETESGLFPVQAPRETSRTRAFLKIQDGCSNRCTYCIVPYARGDSRSQHRDLVLQQAQSLASWGYREICLTGVDIADYGNDLYKGEYGLPELVHDLMEIGGFRLRIGSVEPLYLSVDTLEKLALPGVCRHFHIPFQSGSDRILREMGRTYTFSQEMELLQAVQELFPGACLGSDLITGFPGETDEDHQRSLKLATDSRVNYLHVFPFSPRPGTPAARMKPLHTETITERANQLREVSIASRKKFRESMIGTEQTVLVEGREVDGRKIGLTDNYIPVAAPSESEEGELVTVELTGDNICWGQR